MAAHEIVIVGGGPAGVSAALSLSRRRPDLTDRIVLLEKERYPRDKYCAGALGGRADRELAAMGVHVDVPSVGVGGLSAALGCGDVMVREPGIGRVVRRIEFDHALALAARARGIRVIEGARVTGVTFSDSGVLVESAAGALPARAVVGADGVGSIVRRAMELPFGRLRAQVVEVDTEPVASDGPRDVLHFDLRDRSYAGYAWDFPTFVAGAALVCRGVYVLHPDALRGTAALPRGGKGAAAPRLDPRPMVDPEAVLRARLAELGLDLRRYAIKRFAERGIDGAITIARPRALLIGEAAGIDPMLGEGIAQAIVHGVLAGEYLAGKLEEGDLRFDDWSARVRRSRLGRDLRFRTLAMRRFYGPGRAAIERYLRDEPVFLHAGLRYFGGLPARPAEVLRAITTAAFAAGRIEAAALLG